jgi:hypothetical protein
MEKWADHERAATLQLQFALFPSKWMRRGARVRGSRN